jgi:hypothetical protein
LDVVTISTKPTPTAQAFLIHGGRMDEGSNRGVIIRVDFSNFHKRQCVDPDDYEWWSPVDDQNGEHIRSILLYFHILDAEFSQNSPIVLWEKQLHTREERGKQCVKMEKNLKHFKNCKGVLAPEKITNG